MIRGDEYQKGLMAIKDSIDLLNEKFGDKIYSVLLYGSFARGLKDFDDIDIMIITKKSLGSIYQITNMFSKEVFCNLLRKYGLLFSVLVYDQKSFFRLKGFPLYEEIKKDGILLYGEKVLVKKTIDVYFT